VATKAMSVFRAIAIAARRNLTLSGVDDRGGWRTIIRESFMGAFQRDVSISADIALQNPTVYACVTQIAGDIGKLGLRLTEYDTEDEIWIESQSAAFSPVIRKPNRYQTRQKFIEQWIISKLIHGNSYILKQRDLRKMVVALYPLDPNRCRPLVSDSGQVFYALNSDYLSGLERDIPAVPASEIIHDTMECLFHPLVGVPPLFAGGLPASQGLDIQKGSSSFFANNMQPGGILLAPGNISDATALKLKTYWEENYTGKNAGRIAVLGDNLKYEPLRQTAVDSQLIEQLKWTDEKICSVFKVPPYKVYVGEMPTYNNSEVLDRIYYSGCLQRLIEAVEALLDEGLNLPDKYYPEFDLDDLMRMDTSLKMKTAADAVGAAIYSPDEGRKKFNLPRVAGGNTPYMQQQNYSLAALAKRDAKADPFEKASGATPTSVSPQMPEAHAGRSLAEQLAEELAA